MTGCSMTGAGMSSASRPRPRCGSASWGWACSGRAPPRCWSQLGFQVAGWSRRAKTVAACESFHGDAGLEAFLARTDILVVLLPLTPETRGLLSMPLFEKLARDGALGGPVLINAGRGGLQVEADIVRAIGEGVLIGASLDVFATEPLDPASPLWGHRERRSSRRTAPAGATRSS